MKSSSSSGSSEAFNQLSWARLWPVPTLMGEVQAKLPAHASAMGTFLAGGLDACALPGAQGRH